MLQSFLSSVTVRLQGRLVPTHSYYYREGGKRASPKRASSRYEMEGDRTAVRLGLVQPLGVRPMGGGPTLLRWTGHRLETT